MYVDTASSLKAQGLSWPEVGKRLGISQEAARSAHRRSVRAGTDLPPASDPAAVPNPSEGGAARGRSVSSALHPDASGLDRPSGGESVGLKSEIELARLHIAAATRAEIRLKHKMLADREINDVLAERLRAFDKALQTGVVPSVALEYVVDGE